MRDKLYRFMRSRYGNDQLSTLLTWTGIVLMIASCFMRTQSVALLRMVLYFVGIILFVYGYIRIFSKQYQKRAAQNRWYVEHTSGIRNIFKRRKKNKEVGKDYKVFTCASCQQMIKVPRGKGKIRISCPKCGNSFIKKT